MSSPTTIKLRYLGIQDYTDTLRQMQYLTNNRDADTDDEIWFVQHHGVFTQGQAGKDEYVLLPGDIPVIKSDRGGHVTYHGPGQITAYLMIDLKRLSIGVRALVTLIEQALVKTLAHWQISAAPKRDAPGVYDGQGRKIASLGLRIRKGCSYHGLNFNINMDMSPWQRINPCGLGIHMTQMADIISPCPSIEEVTDQLSHQLMNGLGYNQYRDVTDSFDDKNIPKGNTES